MAKKKVSLEITSEALEILTQVAQATNVLLFTQSKGQDYPEMQVIMPDGTDEETVNLFLAIAYKGLRYVLLDRDREKVEKVDRLIEEYLQAQGDNR